MLQVLEKFRLSGLWWCRVSSGATVYNSAFPTVVFLFEQKIIKGRMIAFVGESLELNGTKQCWLT